MDPSTLRRTALAPAGIAPPEGIAAADTPGLTPAGEAALAAARALARKATAPATVGAYLASLAESHARTRENVVD
jgi:tRNA A37 threonylcarbamoyltransferase TsaD